MQKLLVPLSGWYPSQAQFLESLTWTSKSLTVYVIKTELAGKSVSADGVGGDGKRQWEQPLLPTFGKVPPGQLGMVVIRAV